MKNINELFSDRSYIKLEAMFIPMIVFELSDETYKILRYKINIQLESQFHSRFRIPLYIQLYKQSF
jgi:hypothetical protein